MEAEGFAFCMTRELLGQVKGVSIDMTYMGFTVDPEVPLANTGGGGCGGGCSGCGPH